MSESDPEPESGTRRLPVIEKDPPSGLEQSASAAAYTPGTKSAAADESRPVRRFWSARRVPAAVVALLCVVGVGLLLYDVAAVRVGQSAMRWRRSLADELATRPLDDVWLIAGAAVAMALGVWLFLLAVTPGLRGLLPMRPPVGEPDAVGMRAGIDRSAAELVLRDRAMEVTGVQSAHVDVGRRKVKARATAHFRDLDDVRADLDAALAHGVGELGLARQPALAVDVRRARKR